MAAVGVVLTEVSQREMPVLKVASDTSGVIYPRQTAEPGWQDWALLLVTLVLVGYGSYLAWDAWHRLLHIIAAPGPREFVVIALAVQVVATLLPPLAFLAVWLTGRRETSWLPGTAVLCVLGFLTDVIEVYAHAIG